MKTIYFYFYLHSKSLLSRVVTGPKNWAMGQKFLGSKPNSILRQIYEHHMMDESFMENFQAILQYLRDGNKDSTVYHSVETMLYFCRQCELKILWSSPERKKLSFGFPKGSPLLPFL